MSDTNVYELEFSPEVSASLFLTNRAWLHLSQSSLSYGLQLAPVASGKGRGNIPVKIDSTGCAVAHIIDPPFASKLDALEGGLKLSPIMIGGIAGMYHVQKCATEESVLVIRRLNLTDLAITQYTLDFNISASERVAHLQGYFFAINRMGAHLELQASKDRVPGGTNQLAYKGGDTYSATISPKHFDETGFDAGYRYQMAQTGPDTFMLERFEQVSYYKERKSHIGPVVTVSFIRPK